MLWDRMESVLKRVLLTIFIFMMAATFSFAEERIWIAPFNSDVIDMASTAFPEVGDYGKWVSGTGTPSSGNYNDRTMLALLGVSQSDYEKVVTFNFNSPVSWKYVSASNSSLYRPFGIDLILKAGTSLNKSNGYVSNHVQIGKVLHLGYSHNTDPSSLTATIIMPRTNGETNTVDGKKYYGSWVDVVLALPGTVNSAGYIDLDGDGEPDPDELEYCKLANAQDYITQFSVTVSSEGSSTVDASHIFILNGYYGTEPEESEDGTVSLLVNRLAAASNLDIKSLVENPTEIAEYSFSMASSYTTSASDRRWTERDYYFFISSDTVGGNEFELRLVGTDGIPLNQYIGVNYVIGLLSDYNTSSSSEPSVWFDGTDSLSYTSSATITSYFPHAEERVETVSTKNVDQRVFSFYDNGSIYIKLPEGTDVDELMAGRYKSYIYFNVVCNK